MHLCNQQCVASATTSAPPGDYGTRLSEHTCDQHHNASANAVHNQLRRLNWIVCQDRRTLNKQTHKYRGPAPDERFVIERPGTLSHCCGAPTVPARRGLCCRTERARPAARPASARSRPAQHEFPLTLSVTRGESCMYVVLRRSRHSQASIDRNSDDRSHRTAKSPLDHRIAACQAGYRLHQS